MSKYSQGMNLVVPAGSPVKFVSYTEGYSYVPLVQVFSP